MTSTPRRALPNLADLTIDDDLTDYAPVQITPHRAAPITSAAANTDAMRRRLGIVCVAALVPAIFMAVVVLYGEIPIIREFIAILGGGTGSSGGVANNVTTLERKSAKRNNATLIPEPNATPARNSTAASPSPIAPPLDKDSQAKLRYLSLVYNEPVTDVSLFDRLGVIYRNTSVGLQSHLMPCFVFPYGYDCLRLWDRKCTMGRRAESSQDTTLLTETQWPSPKMVVGDNEWLEVTRWGMDEGNGYGCFFNVRQGSGVFINTKKTIVVQNNTHAKAFFNMSEHKQWANYCPYARELGYDSVQIVNALDGNSNQFVFCTGTCATEPVTGACIKGIEFRTGVQHDKPCECDEAYPLINCGAAITPKGKQHICDQKWHREEEKTASNIVITTSTSGKQLARGKLRIKGFQ